mmetsp:Transcript_136792/g.381316  ORF Transcript_136792/g.381316 Transcript_136792/m.381316 type:complete len:236 (+) Transcript_136792:765-1472(+)
MPNNDVGTIEYLALANAGTISGVCSRPEQTTVDDPLEFVQLDIAFGMSHGNPLELGRLAHPQDDVATVCYVLRPQAVVLLKLVLDVSVLHNPQELSGVGARPEDDVHAVLELALSRAEAKTRFCLEFDLVAIKGPQESVVVAAARPEDHVGARARLSLTHTHAHVRGCVEPHQRTIDLPTEGVLIASPKDEALPILGVILAHAQPVLWFGLVCDVLTVNDPPEGVVFCAMPEDDI